MSTTSNQPLGTLSTMTGLSEAELQRRASELQQSGKLGALAALGTLLHSMQGVSTKTVNSFQALAATSIEAHAIDEPRQAFNRPPSMAGFAAAPPEPPNPAAHLVLDRAAKRAGQKLLGGLMDLSNMAGDFGMPMGMDSMGGADADDPANSRNLIFEKMKDLMQKISQGTTLMGGVLTMMHDTAKVAINNAKA